MKNLTTLILIYLLFCVKSYAQSSDVIYIDRSDYEIQNLVAEEAEISVDISNMREFFIYKDSK